jgi:predicted nucleic acid binding AN1-type Zn finger protein
VFGSLSSSPSGNLMSSSASPPKAGGSSRCFSCQKKVGLLGFKCRCDQTFCSTHRHADAHACPFDYKAAGREELAKANPLVVTKKLQNI